MRKFSEKLTS